MTTIREYGARVRFREEGERWHLEIVDLKKLRSVIGDDILVSFARAFAVADRLITFHDVIAVLQGPDHKSARYHRSGLTLMLLVWATVREATEVIETMALNGVEFLLSDKSAWNKLRELPRR